MSGIAYGRQVLLSNLAALEGRRDNLRAQIEGASATLANFQAQLETTREQVASLRLAVEKLDSHKTAPTRKSGK